MAHGRGRETPPFGEPLEAETREAAQRPQGGAGDIPAELGASRTHVGPRATAGEAGASLSSHPVPRVRSGGAGLSRTGSSWQRCLGGGNSSLQSPGALSRLPTPGLQARWVGVGGRGSETLAQQPVCSGSLTDETSYLFTLF